MEKFTLSDWPSALGGLVILEKSWVLLLPQVVVLPPAEPPGIACVLELQSDGLLDALPVCKEQPTPPLLMLPLPTPLEQDESSRFGIFSGVLATVNIKLRKKNQNYSAVYNTLWSKKYPKFLMDK